MFFSNSIIFMSKVLSLSSSQLKQYIERLERLDAEKAVISEDIREVFAEAKNNGYDIKILRKVLQLRKVSTSDRFEQEILLDSYLNALGMVSSSDN